MRVRLCASQSGITLDILMFGGGQPYHSANIGSTFAPGRGDSDKRASHRWRYRGIAQAPRRLGFGGVAKPSTKDECPPMCTSFSTIPACLGVIEVLQAFEEIFSRGLPQKDAYSAVG
jgi:hypothetical protein